MTGAGMGYASRSNVFALCVLPDDDKVDAVGVAHLGGHPGERPDRAHVHRKVQLLAEANDETPHQLMVGNIPPADGTEENGIELLYRFRGTPRHRGALTEEPL